jgi:hypothetical protein
MRPRYRHRPSSRERFPSRRASRFPMAALCEEYPLYGRIFVKSFFLAKILYTYTMNFFHQEKSIRDHEACPERGSTEYAYLW